MFVFFIVGLLLGSVTVVFVLQNVEIVTVTFFAWQLDSPLAIILIMAILSGVLVTLLMVLPGSIENYFMHRRLDREVKKLEEDLRKQQELTYFAKKIPPTPEHIAKIENGAIHNPAD